MTTRILYLFTRTPLHVGAGSSVGAIDQPIQRERHTGFPVIPASSLKGSFADQWPTPLRDEKSQTIRVVEKSKATAGADHPNVSVVTRLDEQKKPTETLVHDSAWLFGSDSDKPAFAGSLIFSEARVLAFPIRSARGSFAWITCPLMLQRAARDGVFTGEAGKQIKALTEPKDSADKGFAIFKADPLGLGADKKQIVLEEYCLHRDEQPYPDELAKALAGLAGDDLFATAKERLVILSNGMMSHFATTACEVAQHVRICDETGTADGGGLFNQENVPSETLFYSVLSAVPSRVPGGDLKGKPPADALDAFDKKVNGQVFQFGGDASTGLGFCTATLSETKGA